MTPDEIVQRHQDLIRGIAIKMQRSYKLSDMDREDLESAGYLEIAKLLHNQEPRVQFKWFVDQCIQFKMRTAATTKIVKYKKRWSDNYAEATMSWVDNEHLDENQQDEFVSDLLVTHPEFESILETQNEVQHHLECLTEDEREFLTKRFGLDGGIPLTLRELCQERDWGTPRTHEALQRIFLKIKENASRQ